MTPKLIAHEQQYGWVVDLYDNGDIYIGGHTKLINGKRRFIENTIKPEVEPVFTKTVPNYVRQIFWKLREQYERSHQHN